MKIFFLFLILCIFISPVLALAQEEGKSVVGPPKSLEELKDMISRGLKAFMPAFKAALAQGLALWQKMYQLIKDWWQKDVDAKFHQWFGAWWEKIEALFNQRKGIFEEELEKETEEMKGSVQNELPAVKNNLWEKLLKIIR
jgi:hypothetical protein